MLLRREAKRSRARQAPAANQPGRRRVSYQRTNSIVAKSGKKGKKSVEPEVEEAVKPTRPISTYIYFSNAMVPKLKEEHKIAHKDAMAKAGELWGTLSEEEKKPYEKKHQDDVAR